MRIFNDTLENRLDIFKFIAYWLEDGATGEEFRIGYNLEGGGENYFLYYKSSSKRDMDLRDLDSAFSAKAISDP